MEEQKIIKERREMERAYKMEEDKKKQKVTDARKVNEQLIQEKNTAKNNKKSNEDDLQNFVI